MPLQQLTLTALVRAHDDPHSPLRAACCRLLLSLYIDCDPHERYQAVPLARQWQSLERVDNEDAFWSMRASLC